MRHIGVALVDSATGAELQSWDSLPREIVYKGDRRTGAIVGAEIGGDALLVDRYLDEKPPFANPPVSSEKAVYDGQRVVVSRQYGEPDYTSIRTSLIAGVKSQAGMMILAYCPQYKQANLTAQATELALSFPGTKGEDLAEPYRTAFLAGRAIWDNIKAVRAHSNVLEQEITALADADLASWQPHGWPKL